MIEYYLFFGLLGLLSWLQSSEFKDNFISRNLKILEFFIPIGLIIFIGLRYKIGTDWFEYHYFYNRVETLDIVLLRPQKAVEFYNEEFFEIGFKYLVSFIKTLGVSFQFFVFVISAFNVYSLFRFLKINNVGNKFMFFLMYYSFNLYTEFDIIRQALAFYVFLFALEYANKSLIKYMLICLIASSLHSSALIFIPMYFFLKMQLSKRLLFFTFFVYFFGYLFAVKCISTLLSLLSFVSENYLFEKIRIYLGLFDYSNKFGIFTIIYSLLIILLLLNFDKLKKISRQERMIILIFLAYAFVSVFFSEIKVVEARFIFFFNFGVAFLFSITTKLVRPIFRLVLVSFYVSYAIVRFNLSMRDETVKLTYTPYFNYMFVTDEDDKFIMEKYLKIKDKVDDYYKDRVIKKDE